MVPFFFIAYQSLRRLANCEHRDASGAERKDEDDTATAILKKKKKPNQLMYVRPTVGSL